jgi:hypothetical protein
MPKIKGGRMTFLKRLFWVYFLLLIFEGALRKWLLPQYSAPLLIIRDPVAVLIIWEAVRSRKWPKQWSAVTGVLVIGLLGLCMMQVAIGETPWFVALYGLRSYLLPFPVAFIMGENLDAEDLRKFGICTLWLLLPLVGLEVAQYLAEPGSLLNAGAYEGAEQIGYTGGHVRASATFSYVTGPISYIPMAAAFIFYGLVNEKFAKKWLIWAASFALILAVPVTGSRTLVFLLAAVLACVSAAAFFGVSQFAKSLKIILPLLTVFTLVSFLPVFSQANGSLFARFSEASGAEGGAEQSLVVRVLNPIAESLQESVSTNNWLGMGMGFGSNVASKLLTGAPSFLAGENEVTRVINELGPIFGIAFMLFRWILELMIMAKALARVRELEPLAWLLVPLTWSSLALGILEQPTEQGFLVIGVAFSLTALKRAELPAKAAPILNPRWRPARHIPRA